MCDTLGKIRPGAGALFAKNSDRSPNEPQVLEWHSAASHVEKKIMTTYIEVDRVKETKSFLLSRPVWLWGGEMGVNECGVCIGNEAVFTKGSYGKSGLTGMDLLRLALERCESAKEAVTCITDLLEKYGQGGNCGYDHNFFYDNGFLIMDKSEIYVLETAGKEWVYKKSDSAAISNRLSLGADGDCYSSEKCDFKKKYTDPLYSYFSQSKQRREMCCSSVGSAETVEDMFTALRRHENEDAPLCRASVGSPCMHYGGLVGDHTTQSLVADFNEKGEAILWATGRSMPCVSIFKPFVLGEGVAAPVFNAGDEKAKEYWLESERFNRNLLGCILPEEYYAERDEIEKELISLSKNADTSAIRELSVFALEKEKAFTEKWSKATLQKGRTSLIFRQNWQKKNEALGK